MAQFTSSSPQYTKLAPSATITGPVSTPEIISQHSQPETRTRSGWKYGLLMFGSLFAGLIVALGHHFFYAWLNDRPLKDTPWQEWVIRIGTAFAFVVKLLFVISATIAYTQRQWLMISSRPFRIRQLDALTGVLGNALCFLHTSVWLRNPVLTTIANVCWLLPLAAVITPGTISVVPQRSENMTSLGVPQLYYNAAQYATIQIAGGAQYQQPSLAVSRNTIASATSGQVLTLPFPFANSSYNQQFYGPAIQCLPANDSMVQAVNATLYQSESNGSGNGFSFVSWVAGDDHGITSGNASAWIYGQAAYASLDTTSGDAATLFVIPNTTFTDLIECKLRNASYVIAYQSQFPDQNVTVTSIEYLNDVNATSSPDGYYDTDWLNHTISFYSEQLCYQSLMDAFGKLMVGYTTTSHYGFTSTNFSSYALTHIDWTQRSTAQSGMEQLFQNMTMSMLGTSSLVAPANLTGTALVLATQYQNVYRYRSRDLFIAYGISFFAALICALIGLHALWSNGASYQNSFSTFVRTTRDPALHGLIDPMDTGADPLPQRIADTKIMMNQSGTHHFEMRNNPIG